MNLGEWDALEFVEIKHRAFLRSNMGYFVESMHRVSTLASNLLEDSLLTDFADSHFVNGSC